MHDDSVPANAECERDAHAEIRGGAAQPAGRLWGFLAGQITLAALDTGV